MPCCVQKIVQWSTGSQSQNNTDKLFPKPPNWKAILDCATEFHQSGSGSGEEGQMDAQNEENARKRVFLWRFVPAVVCFVDLDE